MMTKIVDKMTKDMDLRLYHDGYKQRIEVWITSKMKGEVAQVEEKKPRGQRQEHDGELRESLNPWSNRIDCIGFLLNSNLSILP